MRCVDSGTQNTMIALQQLGFMHKRVYTSRLCVCVCRFESINILSTCGFGRTHLRTQMLAFLFPFSKRLVDGREIGRAEMAKTVDKRIDSTAIAGAISFKLLSAG